MCLSAICAKSWRRRRGVNTISRPFGVEAIGFAIRRKCRRYLIPDRVASAAAYACAWGGLRGLFLIPRPDPCLNGDRQAQLLCPFWPFCRKHPAKAVMV